MTWQLLHADCRVVMSNMGDETIDAVVCDPPYHLTSIVKRFGPGSAPQQFGTDGAFARAARGFMGQTWDGGDIAFDPTLWAEVLRVLKPGGHLVAFSGTRTYHRMACAIEDAGFEIRDMLEWLYGSGFPKGGLDDEGRGSALKPAHEPMCLARKSFKGSAAGCVEAHGTGLLNIDACRVPSDEVTGWGGARGGSDDATQSKGRNYRLGEGEARPVLGRFPANVCHDGSLEVVAQFPAEAKGGAYPAQRGANAVYGASSGGSDFVGSMGDSGSAARFFYCAKASRRDRNEGVGELAGNIHPTVKPTDLMRWLVRLVCPPGGVVFDPFAGSGSTGKAALLEGRRFIGVEMTAEYIPIARARIEYAARLTAGSN
jgi:site-specific DNA-methyltransferase (adenine-specific)